MGSGLATLTNVVVDDDDDNDVDDDDDDGDSSGVTFPIAPRFFSASGR